MSHGIGVMELVNDSINQGYAKPFLKPRCLPL